MAENVSMTKRAAYQTVQVEQGGVSRRVYGAKRLRDATHTLVVQTTDGATAKDQPQAWWMTDLRRGRLNIYGGLLRFIDHLHRRGIPMETALLIPEWIAEYIRETWTGRPGEDAVKVYRSGEYRKVG